MNSLSISLLLVALLTFLSCRTVQEHPLSYLWQLELFTQTASSLSTITMWMHLEDNIPLRLPTQLSHTITLGAVNTCRNVLGRAALWYSIRLCSSAYIGLNTIYKVMDLGILYKVKTSQLRYFPLPPRKTITLFLQDPGCNLRTEVVGSCRFSTAFVWTVENSFLFHDLTSDGGKGYFIQPIREQFAWARKRIPFLRLEQMIR